MKQYIEILSSECQYKIDIFFNFPNTFLPRNPKKISVVTPNFRGDTPDFRGDTPDFRGDTPDFRGIPLISGVPTNDSIGGRPQPDHLLQKLRGHHHHPLQSL